VPWITLNYIIAEVNYGGRVTDDKDVRLISSILVRYFNKGILEDGYKLSPLENYYAPPEGSVEDVREFIKGLPVDESPLVFGFHPNALITAQNNEAQKFLDTIISVQPRLSSGGGGKSSEDIVAEMAAEFLERMPKAMNAKAAHPKTYEATADGGIISLGVFHGQELDRFNCLVNGIKKSLVTLDQAIKGLVVMSAVMEDMFNCFLNQKLPGNWTGIAYPCLKPLNSWVADFILRMQFMNTWLTQSMPKSYWLPCFYFPQGFMTAAMQVHARATKIPIDTLAFYSDITTCSDERVCDAPASGVNLHGLIIQGGGWNVQQQIICESDKDVLFVMMPVIWLAPTLQKELPAKVEGRYSCPLYKTSERKGTLSTTGHSTNFICYMTLGTAEPDLGHWVRRGIAMLCMLDT